MKKIQLTGLLIILSGLFPLLGYSQCIGDTILSAPPTVSEITACNSILLKQGFSFTASSGQSLVLKINTNLCSVPPTPPTPPMPPYVPGTLSLSANQNYMVKITPLAGTDKTTVNDIFNAVPSLVTVQYYDGLGRPVETVQRGITPAKADLVIYQEYDSCGRDGNTWLPAVASGNNGAYMTQTAYTAMAMTTYNSTTYNAAGDANPYTHPVYEASPLNRVLQQFGPGADWQNNNKSVATSYQTNSGTSGVLSCALFTVTGTGVNIKVNRNNYYADAQLYVTQTTDEDGNISYEFKDKLGQVVLTRQILNGDNLDTYYVYDDLGNLCFVLPPIASSALANGPYDETNATVNQYVYIYKYDNRNRCIAEKLPGCELTYYVYDGADRLIFKQDGENRRAGVWQFSIPDVFGRTVLTGICKDTISVSNKIVKGVYSSAGSYKRYNIQVDGVDKVFANTPNILSVNFYDNYDFRGMPEIPASGTDYAAESGYGACYGDHQTANAFKSKGLLTGTLTAQMNPDGTVSSTYLYSVMYYDDRGRVVQTKSNNSLTGGMEKEYIAYDFSGQPTGKEHVHTATGKTTQTEIYSYTYDHAERLLKTTHQLNGGTIMTISENTYDEPGRLKTNKKGGQANLNSTYAYNIRSWVKSIVSPLFAENLYYNESYGGGAKLYNGNISAMNWKLSNESMTRGYAFSYNNLSWLTAGDYLENGAANSNYKTSYIYDNQGNIISLLRYGKTDRTTYGLIDSLTLTYTGNQLLKVEDAVADFPLSESADFKNYSDTPIEYTYNANGAMTQDLNKGISDIQYNSLNLPEIIDILNSKVEARNEYTYSSDGRKLQVVHRWNPNIPSSPITGTSVNLSALTEISTTDYIGNMIYEDNALKRILIDGGYIEDGVYYYYLTDHQGNNRLVVSADGTVIQRNHYYPFGMAFSETPVEEQGKQPYKYNGKELDQMNTLNLYDYVARPYDPNGWFLTTDPLAGKYPWLSPYAYCGNNPIRNIDPTGKTVRPADEEALKMIQNTLTTQDMQYVRFDADGNIDKDYLNSHTSESGNYGTLLELVNSDIITDVSLASGYTYMDNDGNMQSKTMSYQEPDPEFADPTGSTLGGTTTGEAGLMGQTLLPGKGQGGANSPDNTIKVIINVKLSPAAQAEMYSHEGNGHALMYVKTGDRVQSGHIFNGSKDMNKTLDNMIIRSKMETVKNMKSRVP